MLCGFLKRAVATCPDAVAIVLRDHATTYRELASAVDGMAERLTARGAEPGQTAAVVAANGMGAITAILACEQAGLRCMLLDPSLKPAEVKTYCEGAHPAWIYYPAGQDPASGWSTVDPAAPASDEAGGFLLLSSGTSGVPKIVIRNRAQTEAALGIFEATLPVLPGDRVLGVLPFCHSFGLLFVLLASLRAGATLYIDTFSPRATAAAIERAAITVLPASPFMFSLLVQTSFIVRPSFNCLRLAVSAGSALSSGVADGFRDRFGVGIAQSYGTTETGPAALGMPDKRVAEPGWVGRPYGGVTFEFLPWSGSSGAAGPCASIAVRSPANASGYLNSQEASGRVFREGVVLTGDIGYASDKGDIFVLGRDRPMINVAGKKVSPAEVEACVRSHPRVSDVAVFAERATDGEETIKAVVVPTGRVTPLELRDFCACHMADFKIPREIVFVKSLAQGVMGKSRLPEAGGNS